MSPYTCTLCLMFSLDPSVVGLASNCKCWRRNRINRSCAPYTCVTWSAKPEFVFPSFLYIKIFELTVQVAFNNRSAFTHHKVNLLKFPLRSNCSKLTDNAFVLLICFCFFHLCCTWSIWLPSFLETHQGGIWRSQTDQIQEVHHHRSWSSSWRCFYRNHGVCANVYARSKCIVCLRLTYTTLATVQETTRHELQPQRP